MGRVVIHFFRLGAEWVLCGAVAGFTGDELPYHTDDPARVTCRRCRKALAKEAADAR